MARINASLLTFLMLSFGVACNSGEFTGAGGKKAEASGTKKDPNGPRVDDKNAGPNELGKPGKEDGPDDNSQNATPNTGTGGEDNNGLNDLLNGLLGGDQNDAVSQPGDDEIVFGGTKVFHIGDSQMKATSCSEGISQYSLAGRLYYFEFQVKEPDTTVTISVNRICGVDYGDTNFLAIAHAGSLIQQQNLIKGATNATISSNSPLAPGRYAVAIESKVGSAEAEDEEARAQDADDFIVGEVRIKASKPISPGKVGAR